MDTRSFRDLLKTITESYDGASDRARFGPGSGMSFDIDKHNAIVDAVAEAHADLLHNGDPKIADAVRDHLHKASAKKGNYKHLQAAINDLRGSNFVTGNPHLEEHPEHGLYAHRNNDPPYGGDISELDDFEDRIEQMEENYTDELHKHASNKFEKPNIWGPGGRKQWGT